MPYKDKEKKREYQRNRARNRRNEFLRGKKCAWCGSTKRLELHHTDKSEKESHRIWSWSQKRFEEETAKCIILCLKCHRKFHATEKYSKQPHGTDARYSRGCRCALCKKAHIIRNNEYRKRLKVKEITGVLPPAPKILVKESDL